MSLIARVPPSSDMLSWHQVYVEKQYEPVVKLIADPLQYVTILDCGANVGYASAYFQEQLPNAYITAIEIDSSNYEILTHNFHGRTIHGGVWSKSGSLSINRDFRDGKEWSYYAVEDQYGDIPAYDIKELVADGITILKMDIEGGEAELFKDDKWLKKVEILAIEIHDEFKVRPTILKSLMAHNFTFQNHGELVVAHRG